MTPAPQTELCSRHVISGLGACMLTSQKQVTGETLLARQMSLFALPQQLIRMPSSQVTYPADQLENTGPQFAVFPLFVFTCVLLCFLGPAPPKGTAERISPSLLPFIQAAADRAGDRQGRTKHRHPHGVGLQQATSSPEVALGTKQETHRPGRNSNVARWLKLVLSQYG